VPRFLAPSGTESHPGLSSWWDPPVDAAEIARAVIAAEDRIHELDSLHLRIEGTWTRTPKSITRAELEKKYPDLEITPERFPAREFQLGYPICIDSKKPAGATGFGFLSSWYGVQGIPCAVVVDQSGRVAGHGSLDEALRKAEKLISEAAGR